MSVSGKVTDSLISIHALHEESDLARSARRAFNTLFQSTLSMRRATDGLHGCGWNLPDFNPRSP